MHSKVVQLLSGEIDGPIHVGRVHQGLAKHYGASSSWVWLSIDTLNKQLLRHPDLKADFYEDLDWLLKHGNHIPDSRTRCFHVFKTLTGDHSRYFKATIKLIQNNKRFMLLSLHRAKESDKKRLIRRAAKNKGPQ